MAAIAQLCTIHAVDSCAPLVDDTTPSVVGVAAATSEEDVPPAGAPEVGPSTRIEASLPPLAPLAASMVLGPAAGPPGDVPGTEAGFEPGLAADIISGVGPGARSRAGAAAGCSDPSGLEKGISSTAGGGGKRKGPSGRETARTGRPPRPGPYGSLAWQLNLGRVKSGITGCLCMSLHVGECGW